MIGVQTSKSHTVSELAASLKLALKNGSAVRTFEPMRKHTTLRVGGPADLLVEPEDEEDLAATLAFSKRAELPVLVVGRGSNLLVRDAGIRGVVISLCTPGLSAIEAHDGVLHCGAGARLKAVAIVARQHGMSGMEFLEGIPGSLGGALRMNAGAMSAAIFDIVEKVRVMDFEGAARDVLPQDLQVAYRNCAGLQDKVAIAAVLRGTSGDSAAIQARMDAYNRKRWQSQPAAPSAGCIFKNPAAIGAGRLIDELGLKGTRVGGAVVSAEHGNFIINEGTATASDVLRLIQIVKERAKSSAGIELELEVQVVGQV